jgi:hypothetical protein
MVLLEIWMKNGRELPKLITDSIAQLRESRELSGVDSREIEGTS